MTNQVTPIDATKAILSFITKTALTFGLIFNLSFTFAPALTTGRMALLIMLTFYGSDALKLIIKFAREYKFAFTTFVLLIPFTLMWMAINGAEDGVMLSRAIWFLLFVIAGTFLYVRMCHHNLKLAMTFYMYAMLIQSLFVFYSVLDPDFRTLVSQILVMGGNIDFSAGVRFSGLTNSGAATVSVQLGLGVAAALVIFSQSRNPIKRIFLLLTALIILISTIFVGRTGLYLSILMLMGFVVLSGRSILIPIFVISFGWSVSLYILSASTTGIELTGSEAKLDRTINWAFDIFLSGESDSADALASGLANLREIEPTELLLGSGRVTEPDGSNYAKHDSGYIHTLYALGLPLSAIFYLSLFFIYFHLLKPTPGNLKLIGAIFVALVFILEAKEPFIFKYTLPFFVLVYAYLTRQQIDKKFSL